MSILMSIKPCYAEKIFKGIKKYEYRKKIPKVTFNRVYVYESAPVKKIVGYFDVDYILQDSPAVLWNKTCEYAGIDFVSYNKYFSDKVVGYAIHIANIKKFNCPLNPYTDIKGFKAPQSFMYFRGSCEE